MSKIEINKLTNAKLSVSNNQTVCSFTLGFMGFNGGWVLMGPGFNRTLGFNGTFEKIFFCRLSALRLNYIPFRVVD